ncbi:MAG: phosphatase [Bacteroidota bacterium]
MELFANLGAEFILNPINLKNKFNKIKAFVSDWDGVFNAGIKTPKHPSSFSEPDSMGSNLLRYDYWIRNKSLPGFAIITGAHNPNAYYLAQRERFDRVYARVQNKREALLHYCASQAIEPHQVAFFFDDANDLSAAEICGLRFWVRRTASPRFEQFLKKHKLCDYITAHTGAHNAFREISEMLMDLNGTFDRVHKDRMDYNESYQKYFGERQAGSTLFLEKKSAREWQEFQPNPSS